MYTNMYENTIFKMFKYTFMQMITFIPKKF